MAPQLLKIGKERLIILRERDYNKLLEKSHASRDQDAADAAESRRRMKEPGGITLTQLKKRLGLWGK